MVFLESPKYYVLSPKKFLPSTILFWKIVNLTLLFLTQNWGFYFYNFPKLRLEKSIIALVAP